LGRLRREIPRPLHEAPRRAAPRCEADFRSRCCGSGKRSEARRRIEALLGHVVNGEGRYLPRVREVWIFGF
jgi:hypothetical protein